MNLRYFWRSVASVLVALFVLSPTLCYASEMVTSGSAIDYYSISTLELDDEDFSNGNILISSTIEYYGASQGSLPYVTGSYDNVNSLTVSNDFYDTTNIFSNDDVDMYFRYWLHSSSNDVLFYEKNQVMDFSATNLYNTITVLDSNNNILLASNWHYTLIDYIVVRFQDRVGNYQSVRVSDFSATQSGSRVNIAFSTVVPCDAYNVLIDIYTTRPYDSIHKYSGGDYTFQSSYGFKTSMFDLGESSQDNSGFFSSIIGWLSSIKDGITDTVNSIKNGFSSVVQSIVELPSRIWTAMENGIKGLFVPSESDMVAYKDKWDTLLSQRFGVVYQSGTIITDTLGSITEQSAQGTINLPAATIHFADTDFTFGGYDVPVVPQGFEWLVEIIKGLIDIVITVAFINAMRTKYDQLMRG